MAPIGQAVRGARARRGWSREALAYHSGISWAAIAQIETGRRSDVRLSTLTALADALGVSVDHLGQSGARAIGLLDHLGLVFQSDEEFLGAVGPLLATGAETGDPVLVVADPTRNELVQELLAGSGRAVEVAEAAPWYEASPTAVLTRYTSFLHQALETGAVWIQVVAEAMWVGRSEAEAAAWIRYEALINLALAAWPVTIVCAYDASGPSDIVTAVERTHPHLCRTDGGSAVSALYEPPEQLLLSSTTDEQ